MRSDVLLLYIRAAYKDARERYPDDIAKASIDALGNLHIALGRYKHGDCHEREIEKVMAEYRRLVGLEDE